MSSATAPRRATSICDRLPARHRRRLDAVARTDDSLHRLRRPTAIAAGHAPGMVDAMIAGIAQAHGLVVVTRNARHFRSFGIRTATPEEAEAIP